MAKFHLSILLPESTLEDLIPAFEDTFGLKDAVSIMDADNELYFGVSPKEAKPAFEEAIEIDKEICGHIRLYMTAYEPIHPKALHYLVQSLGYIGLEAQRRQEISDELLERYDELNLMYELGNSFVKGKAQDEIIKNVLEDTKRLFQADAGVIYIWNAEKSTIEPIRFFGNKSNIDFWGGRMRELALSTLYAYDQAQLFDAEKVICAPLRYNDDMLGSLVLFYEREAVSFKASDVNLLTTLTHNIALFLYAAQLLERLAQEKNTLETTLKELQATRDKLNQAERLSIIGQTVSTLIHDIRKPLSNAMGYAGLLQETDLSQEERHEFAEQIIKYITLFSDMMQEILDYVAGNEKLQKTTVDVNVYMQEVKNMLMPPGLELPVKIIVNYGDLQAYKINIDTQRFSRVFQNLVNNAIDAIEGHSGTQVEVNVKPLDTLLEFSITDDGPGVPPEIAESLFQPFVTMGKSHGTGLGLAIVDRMVSIHGGKIRFEAPPTGGARFVFTVPFLKSAS